MNDPFGTFDTDQERARRVQFTAELLRVADDAARSNSVESWTPVTEMLMESTVLLPIAHAGNEAPIQENAASVPIVVNDDGEYLLPWHGKSQKLPTGSCEQTRSWRPRSSRVFRESSSIRRDAIRSSWEPRTWSLPASNRAHDRQPPRYTCPLLDGGSVEASLVGLSPRGAP
jgi:hypothetical protein